MRRLSIEQKEQRGTLRPCRERLPGLTPIESLPLPPDYLPPDAVRAYEVIGGPMVESRRLTEADMPALEAAASAFADWRAACEDIKKHGALPTVTRKDGSSELKCNPAIAVRNESDRRFRNWLQSLGATPSDRSKIVELAAAPEVENHWGDLLDPPSRPDLRP